MNTIDKIKKQILTNQIIIYMKGSPDAPNCGFSAKAVQILSNCGKRFAYIDVLEHTDIRSELPKYSNWPTFPQLWINGKLIGGCDIIVEMYRQGKLQEIIKGIPEKL